MKQYRLSLIIFTLLLCATANAQKIKGSDTLLPVSQEAAECFMKENRNSSITVTGVGT